MEKFQFPSMIEKLKQSPKTIVFTEGTDARILEAAAELLKDSFLKPILVGSEAEVKAAADKGGFNIAGADKSKWTICTTRLFNLLCQKYVT